MLKRLEILSNQSLTSVVSQTVPVMQFNSYIYAQYLCSVFIYKVGVHFNMYIHSPKCTLGLTGTSVIKMLVAPAGMMNPSW